MNWNTLAGLVYSVVGLFAYGLTLAASIKLRKKIFSPAFLPLYFIAAIVDFLTHINTWIMYRLRFEPAFFFYFAWIIQPEMGILRNLQLFLVNFFYFDQNACVFLLTLNRYTVIFYQDRHEWLWKTYKWAIIGGMHFASFGICFGARMASMHANVTFIFNDLTPSYELRGDADSKPILIATICYGVVMLVSCSFMSERDLTVITLLTFSAQAANIFTAIISSTLIIREDWETLKLITPIVPYFSDLFSLGPAVYTLLAPGPINSFYIDKISQWFQRKCDSIITCTRGDAENQSDA